MEKLKQEDIDKAFYMAEKARNNSYSPYSKFKVGACIKTKTNDFLLEQMLRMQALEQLVVQKEVRF